MPKTLLFNALLHVGGEGRVIEGPLHRTPIDLGELRMLTKPSGITASISAPNGMSGGNGKAFGVQNHR